MSIIRLAALATACTILLAGEALAVGVSVPMDEVALVSFKKPVSTVYLGNSSIAELTMLDSRHVFVLGKSFGTTNLIALGADRAVIVNEAVIVSERRSGGVTVIRGADTFNYSCSRAHCEARPLPGDPKGFFDNMQGSVNAHEDAAAKAAGAGSQTQSIH